MKVEIYRDLQDLSKSQYLGEFECEIDIDNTITIKAGEVTPKILSGDVLLIRGERIINDSR